MRLCNLDGVITPEAAISVFDRGFLYGDSIYEVIRTYRGIPFALPEHLAPVASLGRLSLHECAVVR